MRVGIPTEIKVQEFRVGITPAGVHALKEAGHTVLVQKGAGLGSMITDEEYVAAGAQMVATAKECWDCDMVVKVKEPLAPEYDLFGGRIQTLASNAFNIAAATKDADLLVGSVLIPGALTPKLVTEAMVKTMKPGSAIVDVAIDQGGCIEPTAKHGATYHDKPTFKYPVNGGEVVCYSVGNMPGAVARTSTFTLTNATMPYMVDLANKGWKKACQDDKALARGINTYDGKVYFKGVSDALGYELHCTCDILK